MVILMVLSLLLPDHYHQQPDNFQPRLCKLVSSGPVNPKRNFSISRSHSCCYCSRCNHSQSSLGFPPYGLCQ
uniref:Putative ovule protein n=1 Tax=Solanum chacoense TaxID=4108 RepID=A0A0V0HGU8_SOLCH